MKIAVFGSNPRSVAIGKLLADAGYQVCFGDAAGVNRAEAAARQAGGVADTPYNDAASCEMLIFAGSRAEVDDLLTATGCISPNAVVVDAMEGTDGEGPDLLAHKLDTHRVVRALILAPQVNASIPYCGDDADAMTLFEEVFRTAGCLTAYRGPLAKAGEITLPGSAKTGEAEFASIKSTNAVNS
ncbi:MAG TPA: NAD(P)-binding domain-containing protein [Candidatus Cybelea sp.]|nr:NAD(P)-binding domain-containing protein [Candidatus Cybelea sp.]